MLDLFPKEVREKIEREGSLNKLVSAFLSLAQDLIESGEADEILNDEAIETKNELSDVSDPVFRTDTSK